MLFSLFHFSSIKASLGNKTLTVAAACDCSLPQFFIPGCHQTGHITRQGVPRPLPDTPGDTVIPPGGGGMKNSI